jgi:hypothetical protein
MNPAKASQPVTGPDNRNILRERYLPASSFFAMPALLMKLLRGGQIMASAA